MRGKQKFPEQSVQAAVDAQFKDRQDKNDMSERLRCGTIMNDP